MDRLFGGGVEGRLEAGSYAAVTGPSPRFPFWGFGPRGEFASGAKANEKTYFLRTSCTVGIRARIYRVRTFSNRHLREARAGPLLFFSVHAAWSVQFQYAAVLFD